MHVQFVRLERAATDSWITLELPSRKDFGDELDSFLAQSMPGWEVVSGCMENPDDGFEYEDWLP